MGAIAIRAFPPRRLAGAALALVLHAALIALLLRVTLSQAPLPSVISERLTWIALRAPPKPESQKTHARHVRVRATTGLPVPDFRGATFPPEPNTQSLEVLHPFLFDCAPENLTNLSPEQRAQCGGTMNRPDGSADFADRTSRSHDAARWARGLARKNNPLLLPCSSPQGIGVSPTTLICLGKGLLNGFDLDAMPGYGDNPSVAQVPNNGDPPPPPTYNMRH